MKKNIFLWTALLLVAEIAAALTLPGLPAGGMGYAAAMAVCVAVVAVTAFFLARAVLTALRAFKDAICAAQEAELSQQKDMNKELVDILKQQGHLLEDSTRTFTAQLDAFIERTEETLQAELKQLREASDNMERHYARTLDDVRTASVESVHTMSKRLQEYSAEMEQRLTGVSDKNTKDLSAVCSGVVSESVQVLKQGNAEMLDRQTAAYEKELADTAARYDAALTAHVGQLKQQMETQIAHMMEVNCSALEDAVTKLHATEEESLQNLSMRMESQLDSLDQKLRAHSMESADLFSCSMEDYRDRFVEASAHALAQVQDDTMQVVANANSKVSELADNINKLGTAIRVIIQELQARSKEEKQMQENFQESFDGFRDDVVRDMRSELRKYSEKLSELGQYVENVMETVKKNTETYQQTLTQIQESQREMNTLNKKDIDLMKELLR